jgi:hypothetical protein
MRAISGVRAVAITHASMAHAAATRTVNRGLTT